MREIFVGVVFDELDFVVIEGVRIEGLKSGGGRGCLGMGRLWRRRWPSLYEIYKCSDDYNEEDEGD